MINGHVKLELVYINYMHYDYATFVCAMLCDGTCSNFITFLHHVDVEGKQVQIGRQVELYSIELYPGLPNIRTRKIRKVWSVWWCNWMRFETRLRISTYSPKPTSLPHTVEISHDVVVGLNDLWNRKACIKCGGTIDKMNDTLGIILCSKCSLLQKIHIIMSLVTS